MEIQDDRTDEEKKTHTVFIVGTDNFLGGWGKAAGGKSFAAWACEPRHASTVLGWVEGRGDMKRVRLVSAPYSPRGRGHLHIYTVTPGHPAIGSAAE